MIIIVAGLPGSGKSFFAEKLAGQIHAEYLNSDRVRISLKTTRKYSLQDKFAVYNEMAIRTGEYLQKGKTVVVDATFWLQSMRELFEKVAKRHSTVIAFILITANEDLIKERLSSPRKDSEADFEVYKKVKDEFQELTTPHLTLESGTGNIETILQKAVAYIKEINEGK